MKKVIQILNTIKDTSSTKQKQQILEQNKDNEMLKKVLFYTYNPYMKYKISEQAIQQMDFNKPTIDTDIFNMLNTLSENNINDEYRSLYECCVSCYDNEEQELIKAITIKDLRIGINSSTINKVWKNLIPEFKVQLAKAFKDVKLKATEEIWLTEKFDGIRCIAIKTGSCVNLYSRQGQEIEGLVDVVQDIKSIEGDFVLDGELLIADNSLSSGAQYKQTMKVVRATNTPIKKGIVYHVFDILSIDEFLSGQSSFKYKHRRSQLDGLFVGELNNIKIVPILYRGFDHNMINVILEQVQFQDKEGVMINVNELYKCKRHNGLVKVKVMNTCDLRIIGFEQGIGKNFGKLGALICEYKGNEVKVGSGFSDEDRVEIWFNKQKYMNKIVEVQFFEESKNAEGQFSLRFPVFLEIRNDKTEPNYS